MAFTVASNTTQLSNIFIDEYMPKAHPPYVMVYLYAYRHILGGNTDLTNQSIANALDLLESDVVRAWKYWQNQGLVQYDEDASVHFLPVVSKVQKQPKPFLQQHPPIYTQEEIVAIGNNSTTAKKLFQLAENHLGRTLSYTDMNTLLRLHEWAGLPLDVIELLFAYCSQIQKCHMNYIEKVALGWAEEGITTSERALSYIKLRQTGYKQIMQAFGQGSRMPAPAEEKYIQKWFSVYQLPLEVILNACEKTILRTGNVSFAYADKILKNWSEQQVQSLADIEKLDETHQQAKQAPISTKKATAAPVAVKRNRFVNYEQRQWDFKELERLERNYLDQITKE